MQKVRLHLLSCLLKKNQVDDGLNTDSYPSTFYVLHWQEIIKMDREYRMPYLFSR